MAVGYNPSIITSNLVMCLDAGNSKSYPGSGTAWYDLSGYGRSATLTNGPTYSGSNGGSIVFAAASSTYALIGNLGTAPATGTISFWMYPTSVSNYQNPFSTNYNSGNVGFRWEMTTAGALYVVVGNDAATFTLYNYATTTMQSNSWYNVTVAWDSPASTLVGYLNGAQVFSSTTHAYWATTFAGAAAGVGLSLSSPDRYFSGRIPQVLMYNTMLSYQANLQNYNAIRGRFGV